MDKAAVYIETSVISYLVAGPSRDIIVAAHQQLTSNWWASQSHRYDLFVSQIVLDEARAGDRQEAARRLTALQDLPVLEINRRGDKTRGEPASISRRPKESGAGCTSYCGSVRQWGRLSADLEL
jgi:hypothetical protein